MAPPRRGQPNEKPEVLTTPPVTNIRHIGRPPVAKEPKKPDFHFTEEEQERYDWFIKCYQDEYPDLTPSDKLILELAGVAYIKLLRMCVVEIETGQLITMARQNPSTDFTRFLDMLSVTRKQRQRTAPAPNDDATDELMKKLSVL